MKAKNEIKFKKNMNFHKKPVWLDISMEAAGGEKMNIPVFCSDSRLINYIIEVIDRLPEKDVKHLTLDKNITIIQSHYSTAFSLKPLEKPRWMLYLYDKICEAEDWYVLFVIVHEIAHIYLNHGITEITDMKYLEKDFLIESPEQEIEADKQLIKWGFGKELKQFQSLIKSQRKRSQSDS